MDQKKENFLYNHVSETKQKEWRNSSTEKGENKKQKWTWIYEIQVENPYKISLFRSFFCLSRTSLVLNHDPGEILSEADMFHVKFKLSPKKGVLHRFIHYEICFLEVLNKKVTQGKHFKNPVSTAAFRKFSPNFIPSDSKELSEEEAETASSALSMASRRSCRSFRGASLGLAGYEAIFPYIFFKYGKITKRPSFLDLPSLPRLIFGYIKCWKNWFSGACSSDRTCWRAIGRKLPWLARWSLLMSTLALKQSQKPCLRYKNPRNGCQRWPQQF